MEETWELTALIVDEEFVKDNDMLLSIFLWQMKDHCFDAGGCYEDLREVLQKRFEEAALRDYIWTNVQGFLSESAKLSKILFSSTKKSFSQNRAKALLSLLDIDNCEMLNLKSRKLRNRTEHIDEDLDSWWQLKKSASKEWDKFAIKAIDGLDDDIIYGPNTELAFMYNPTTGVMYHLDEEFDIHGIFKDVVSVSKALSGAFLKLNKIAGTTLIRESR